MQRAQLKASKLARQRREAVQGIGEAGPERRGAEPKGGPLEAQLLRIISEVAPLSEEQLNRVSELLRTSHQAGGDGTA